MFYDSFKVCKKDVAAFMEYVKPTFCKVSFYEDYDMGEVAEFEQFQTKEEVNRAYEWWNTHYLADGGKCMMEAE